MKNKLHFPMFHGLHGYLYDLLPFVFFIIRKKMKSLGIAICLIATLLSAIPIGAANENRGKVIRTRSQYEGATLREKYTGTNHALIIGIDEYRHKQHPDLKTAVKDAVDVAKILEKKYYFDRNHITLLKNKHATKERIMHEFRDLVKTKVKKGDNVFIYYAGHGWYDETWETGYWITTEASSPTTYLENTKIQKVIEALDRKEVRHVLLVSDSCFSGALTREHTSVETDIDDRYFKEKYEKPSRNIITSGGLEPVADSGKKGHSIFAYYFLKILEEHPGSFLSGKQLGLQVEKYVTRNSDQTPEYRYIHGAGDESGQFFFINKQSKSRSMPDAGSASFDDIIKQGELRKQWSKWQANRNREYQEVREIDANDYILPEQKYKAWSRFRSGVKKDNPFSKSDDTMRAYAASRIVIWKNAANVKNYSPKINDRAPIQDAEKSAAKESNTPSSSHGIRRFHIENDRHTKYLAQYLAEQLEEEKMIMADGPEQDNDIARIHISGDVRNTTSYNKKKSKLTAAIIVKTASGEILSTNTLKASERSEIDHDAALDKASRLLVRSLTSKGLLTTLGLK